MGVSRVRITLGGSDVDLRTREQVLEDVRARLRGQVDGMLALASANLDHLHHFGIDSGREGCFERDGADWLVLLDGMPLVWAARRMTGESWEQLAGSDLLPDVLRVAARERARVGFLGGTERQHRVLATTLAARHPGLVLAGTWAPPRAEVDDPTGAAEIARRVAEARVDVLVVGLGKPRQEDWLLRHGADTGASVALAFGAAADFLAGTVDRAPERWRAVGMEWAYRLLREPRRLTHRYVVQGPASALRLLLQSRSGVVDGLQGRRALLTAPHRWRRRLGRVLVAGDVLAITIANAVAYLLRQWLGDAGLAQGFDELPIALAVVPLWLLSLHAFACYRPQYFNAGGEGYRRFVAGSMTAVLSLGFLSFAFDLRLSRLYVVLLAVLAIGFGTALRAGIRGYLGRARRAGRFQQNVVVVGADDEGVQLAAAMTGAEVAGYRTVGFVDDELPVGGVVRGLPVLGRVDEVLDVAFDAHAGLVVVSPTGVRPGTLRDLTVALEGSDVDLAVAPSVYETALRRVTVEAVSSVPVMHVDQIRLGPMRSAAKRAFDLVGASLALAVALPLLLAVALAVRLDTDGPVVFRQQRVGRDGRHFTLLKFRTMVQDAERRLHEVADRNEAGECFFKLRDDPRVTRVGRVLRQWSLDELPQLANVLRGDLSLVGPRPPLPSEVEKYEAWHLRRLRVTPGMTGVWQTSGRSDISFDEAVRMDLFYIENWSLGYDLFLLAKTVRAVLSRRGAY